MGVPEKTLITGEEILEYIPQRPPVVMVDTFYGIDERGVRTQRADRYGGQPARCGRGAGRVRHRGAHRPVGRPEGGLHEPHDGPKGCSWGTSAP